MGRDAACDDDSRSEGEALAGYRAGPEEIWGVPLWSDGLLPTALPLFSERGWTGTCQTLGVAFILRAEHFQGFFFVYFPSQHVNIA
jgi:hypothetical protein